MKTCSVEGCTAKFYGNELCKKHYMRMWVNGDLELRVREKGSGTINGGYHVYGTGGVSKKAHIAIAEKVLGKKLPAGAVIHHVDGNGLNNDHTNLVLCDSVAYHALLHQRQRAYDATGDPEKRKCAFCKEYDNIAAMVPQSGTSFTHAKCRKNYNKVYHAARKQQLEAICQKLK